MRARRRAASDRFDPTESIAAAHACAPVYLDGLADRHVLFIPNDGSEPVETFYGIENFMHLCGVHYPDVGAEGFWDMALAGRLRPDGLRANNAGVAAKRLVLSTLVRIDRRAAMLVRDPVLPGRAKADVICANLPNALGFMRRGGELRPCSALHLEGVVTGAVAVLMTLKTEPGADSYTLAPKLLSLRDPSSAARRMVMARRSLALYSGRLSIDRDALALPF